MTITSKSRITTVQGDLVEEFEQFPNSVMIQGCNALGVMGKGIALQIKDKWPAVFDAYITYNKHHGLYTGDIIPVPLLHNSYVINAITQFAIASTKWDKTVYVDYAGLERAFIKINQFAIDNNLESVMFPKIGCGLANGDWEEVKKIINRSLTGDFEIVYWEFVPK